MTRIKRLKDLKLDHALEKKYRNSQAFQEDMALKLRGVAMRALRGDISRHNLSLQRMRANLDSGVFGVDEIGLSGRVVARAEDSSFQNLASYLAEQEPDHAEARDLSLAALAEALEINIVLCRFDAHGQVTSSQKINMSDAYDMNKPTICMAGGYGHWEAVVDCEFDEAGEVVSGRKVPTVGDGNCGYNAVALALAAIEGTRNAPRQLMERAPADLWKGRMEGLGKKQDEEQQERILQAIGKVAPHDDPALLASKILDAQTRLLGSQGERKNQETPVLPSEEEQFKKDEVLAWEIAAKDMKDEESEEEDFGRHGPS